MAVTSAQGGHYTIKLLHLDLDSGSGGLRNPPDALEGVVLIGVIAGGDKVGGAVAVSRQDAGALDLEAALQAVEPGVAATSEVSEYRQFLVSLQGDVGDAAAICDYNK